MSTITQEGKVIRTPIPEGAVVHYQGFRDPIDGTLRVAVTRCGVQLTPGTWVTDQKEKLNCEACAKAKA